MIEAWSPEDVRAAEEALMEQLPEGELIQRAATGLAAVVRARLAERRGSNVVALVGPGNNGADALYAVTHLARDGFPGMVVRSGRVHLEALAAAEAAGITVVTGRGATDALRGADVVVDGVLGIGGRPGLPEFAHTWVDAIPDDSWVIAVDLPSGQDPHGEQPCATGVFADETVTFAAAKPVHLLPGTEASVGWLTVVDIGLDLDGRDPAVQRLTRDDVADLWPVPTAEDDKYSRGVLGIVAGGEDYTGAPIMATTAAVCAGAGMVRYIGTPTPTHLLRTAVPEAVFGVGRVQAWVIGPGMDVSAIGTDAVAQLEAARDALASDLPVLLDAGGLDLLERRRDAPTLLTPHAGELARLLTRLGGGSAEVTAEGIKAAPLARAREAADLTGATVLLKGSTTLVVPPTNAGLPVRSQNDAPAWLATAGAGDVLAGLIGTLLAGGLSPLDAGSLGALVHGVAADSANPGGPVRALDVAHGIPTVVAGLLHRPA